MAHRKCVRCSTGDELLIGYGGYGEFWCLPCFRKVWKAEYAELSEWLAQHPAIKAPGPAPEPILAPSGV